MAARRATLRVGRAAAASRAVRRACASVDAARRPPARFMAARRWVPLSLAATLLLAVAGAFFYRPERQRRGARRAAHARSRDAVFSSRPSASRMPMRRPRPATGPSAGLGARGSAELAASELELLGVRRCIMSSGPRGAYHVQVARAAALGVRAAARRSASVQRISRNSSRGSGTRRSSGRRGTAPTSCSPGPARRARAGHRIRPRAHTLARLSWQSERAETIGTSARIADEKSMDCRRRRRQRRWRC